MDGAALPAEKNIVGEHNAKTDIVVEVIRIVPVTNGTANVVSIVVPRTAAQHTRSHGLSHFMCLISSNLPVNDQSQPALLKHAHIG